MSYVEIIYVDSESQGRKTGLFFEWETPEATWAAFRAARIHDVGVKACQFLVDYYNRKGDLSHTIGITAAAFETITGKKPESEEYYRNFDRDFWKKEFAEVRKNLRRSPDAVAAP